MYLKSISFLILTVSAIYGQVSKNDNFGNAVNGGLVACYNETEIPKITQLQTHLPATINILIDLIRKVENNPNTQMDARALVVSLLRRFRQDGIVNTNSKSSSDNIIGLPYAAKRGEWAKNKLLFKKLLGDASPFNNASLTPNERCNVHYLISSTIYSNLRGDESSIAVCNSASASTIRRRETRKKRQEEQTNNTDTKNPSIERFETVVSTERSSCPLELGVVKTDWGLVKIGNVLNGISTGLESQVTDNNVDVRFGSTLSGELAEAAINQASTTIRIGASAKFNSTLSPKTAFTTTTNYLQVTDAELRGSLDGLYIALAMDDIKANYSNIKLSQILDMYYSNNGINQTLRACNRNIMQTNYFTDERLIEEVKNIMNPLIVESNLLQTIPEDQFEQLATSAVSAFTSYFSTLANNLECESSVRRISTNLSIYLDRSVDYSTIQPLLSYILENLDVNPYESSYSLLDGNSNVIVNATNYLSDFYEKFNSSDQLTSGFDYSNILENIITDTRNNLDNTSYVSGRNNIVLLVTKTDPSDNEKSFFEERRNTYLQKFSNLKILVLTTSSTKSNFQYLVTDTTNDVFTFSEGQSSESDLQKSGDGIVELIQDEPRTIVNPYCGSDFDNSNQLEFILNQYVEPTGIINYTIPASYFYSGSDDRSLVLTESGSGKIYVCVGNDLVTTNCTILQNNETSIPVSQFCADRSFSDCSPIQLTVEGVTTDNQCTDSDCRFPNSIKYTIKLKEVVCTSDASRLFGNFVIVSLLLYFLRF